MISKIWISERVAFWWGKCHDMYGISAPNRFAQPTISYWRMKRAAGKARTKYWAGVSSVRFSTYYMERVSPEVFDQTVGHEVAHCFIDLYTTRRNLHNNAWRDCMVRIGLPPERCHDYKVDEEDKGKIILCPGCQQKYRISKHMATRILNGRSARCYCKVDLRVEAIKTYYGHIFSGAASQPSA